MFTRIKDFETAFATERGNSQKILGALTDGSLSQSVARDHRTLGRMAWHIVTTYPEMMGHAGLRITGVGERDPLPASARAIGDGYDAVTGELLEQIKRDWTDATLLEERDFYGSKWPLGMSLEALICHEIHHRGQMTVLMRQAGLKVPGIYGPALEEWAMMGAPTPEV